jgi:hypothetical protein
MNHVLCKGFLEGFFKNQTMKKYAPLQNFFGVLFPGALDRSKIFLICSENLPFKTATIEPLDYGCGSTVYWLEEEKSKSL